MAYIFIRHAEKAYANNKGPEHAPRFDPPIVDFSPSPFLEGVSPSLIITSPILRCRQTVESNFPGMPYQINVLLTEYLGNQISGCPSREDFEVSTHEYHKEFKYESNTPDLYKRLVRARRSLPSPYEGETIVVVTHGLCLEYLSDIFIKENQRSNSLKIKFFEKDPKNGFMISLK